MDNTRHQASYTKEGYIFVDGIKGRKNLEIVEMKPNLKNLNDIHREKSGKRTGNTSTV